MATAARDWLLIDCAHKGEVRLAQARPAAVPELGATLRYETSIPTFTDVLLRYAQQTGQALDSLEPVVAIAGVPGARSMVIERSRWVISRDGLSSLFGKPPVILNEVAAQAWALRASLQGVTPVYGQRLPDLTRTGRYLFLTYDEGVGTAVLDIDESGRCAVLDAEGGQIDFAAITEPERQLVRMIAVQPETAVSWEQVLMLRRDPKATVLPDGDRIFARLLGRFVSNLIYASGTWNGAFITGQLIPPPDILNAEFGPALTTRRPYPRLMTQSAVFRVSQANAVLRGCAEMMAARYRPA